MAMVGFYALAVAAGMFTHVMMAFGVLANVLWLLLCHRRHLLHLIVSGAIAVLLFLPWVYSSRHVKGFIDNPQPRTFAGSVESGFSVAVLPYTFYTFATGFSLGPSVAELHENRSLGFIQQFLPLLLAVGIIVGTLLLIGMRALYQQLRCTMLGPFPLGTCCASRRGRLILLNAAGSLQCALYHSGSPVLLYIRRQCFGICVQKKQARRDSCRARRADY